jgi:hypothetical protein
MTLSRFNKLLKKVSPKLRVRQRAYGDIASIYAGSGYIIRLTKGEFHLKGFSKQYVNPQNPNETLQIIQKRGRQHVVNILKNYRWIKNHKQKTMLLYGIENEK